MPWSQIEACLNDIPSNNSVLRGTGKHDFKLIVCQCNAANTNRKKLLKTMKQVPRNIASKKLVRRSFAYLYKTQCVTFVLTKTTNYSIVHMNEGE